MRQGKSPTEAATLALTRIAKYYPKFSGGLVVVNKDGEFGKFCCFLLLNLISKFWTMKPITFPENTFLIVFPVF